MIALNKVCFILIDLEETANVRGTAQYKRG